ncbi:hypothetical protein P153DRAFT_365953 [Dothidotthia symphoricarpi CBS 119687]|uniref:Uncharacterized protein n=1 Tax=Dothidotthia symphoricarpi CBS 119687 TaxID=1392245 RepID=A0A6A6AEM5_9PLEO|nr:uncharacterized protein P153DRAFT_365953 [Dothidotthia symphoricarpi CBS 119687]KAF2130339.1 hypothetical protein P153DRAFT_365953 [Dothidotthia symphoricarpi CBS 119687]
MKLSFQATLIAAMLLAIAVPTITAPVAQDSGPAEKILHDLEENGSDSESDIEEAGLSWECLPCELWCKKWGWTACDAITCSKDGVMRENSGITPACRWAVRGEKWDH